MNLVTQIISPVVIYFFNLQLFPGHKNMNGDSFCSGNLHLFYRSGSSNALGGINKLDGSSQPGSSARAIPRNDVENVALLNDKRDRAAGLEKERVTTKGGNKYVYDHATTFSPRIFIGICVVLVTK